MRLTSITAAVAAASATAAIAVAASASGTTGTVPGPSAGVASNSSALAADVVAARDATAKYATNLAKARAAGYQIITRMIPNMGYHFMNAKVSGFNVRKPPILVYERRGKSWHLGALEWVFTSIPAKPPLPGATYGAFGAACHYADGTFVFAAAQSSCAATSPKTHAKFSFWHPNLVTLHFWVWYPNPSGIYMGINPLASPFNNG